MLSSYTFLLVKNGFSKKQISLHKKNITGKANKGKVIRSDSINKVYERSLSTSGVTRKGSILSNTKRKREEDEIGLEMLKSVTHILVHQNMTFEKLGDILPVSYYYDISINRIQVPIVKIGWLSACLTNGCVGEVEEFLVAKEEEQQNECEEEKEDLMDTKLNRYSLWEKDHLLRACPLESPNDDIVDALREIGEFYQFTNKTTRQVRYSLTSNLPIFRFTFLESKDV